MAAKKSKGKGKKTVYKTVKHKGVRKGTSPGMGLSNLYKNSAKVRAAKKALAAAKKAAKAAAKAAPKKRPSRKAGAKVCVATTRVRSPATGKMVARCSGYAYPRVPVFTKGGKGSVTRVRGNLCRRTSGPKAGKFVKCSGKAVAAKGRAARKGAKGKKYCKSYFEVPSPVYGHTIRRCADFVTRRK